MSKVVAWPIVMLGLSNVISALPSFIFAMSRTPQELLYRCAARISITDFPLQHEVVWEKSDRWLRCKWPVLEPLLPNKPRGVPRVDDYRVLSGIFWRSPPFADIPERFGPPTTCYSRFVRWREAGIWDRHLSAVSEALDGDFVMIDSSSVRVHQHGAFRKKKERENRG